jgi:hypothetical protein
MHLARLSLLTLASASFATADALADGREPGSLLIYPLQQSALLDPTVFNVVSVTNTNRAGNATTEVHFEYVNVAPSPTPFLFANCNISDRVETLTPADTLSILTSCHNGATNARGYLVVTARDPDEVDTPWSFDHLVGSQQIVTLGGGIYSLEAIPFTSPRPERAKTDVSPNDGQRDFDGVEYEPIPDELYIDSYNGALAGRIALVSLTGPEYLTNVDFIIYNDDEFQLSGQYSFACWAHVPLADISGYFTSQGLATTIDDPSELDITCDDVQEFDTGWAIVRPKNALSITSDPISDPAVLGALTLDGGPFNNGRLLWESIQKQTNGKFASNGTPSAPSPLAFAAATNFAVGLEPISAAIGDLNGDGILDVVTLNLPGPKVSVLLGVGDGTFDAPTTFSVGVVFLARWVSIGDLNGDGNLDLVTANQGSSNVSVLLGAGDGTFGAPTIFAAGSFPWTVSIGDLNGDGDLDLVTASTSTNKATVLLGVGNGTFGAAVNYATGSFPSAVSIADLNGDGALDLVTTNLNSDSVSVLLGAGNGTFGVAASFLVGDQPIAVSIGDLDGDGDLDLATANSSSDNVSVLLGAGDGTFGVAANHAVGDKPSSMSIGDLDGDGDFDLVTANSLTNTVSVLLGNGDGTFGASASFVVGNGPNVVLTGDLDSDGALDLVTANGVPKNVSVLINQP